MKSTRSQNTKQSKQGASHNPKPDIRDDLDSRKEKEVSKLHSRDRGKRKK